MNSLNGLSWNDKNSHRNYPFLDNSNLAIGSSGFIPNDLIVDARIYIRGCYEAATTPYVSRLELTSDKAIFRISCNGSELGAVDVPYSLANSAVSENAGTYIGLNPDNKFAVRSVMQQGISSGMLVIKLQALDTLQSIGEGAYDFAANRLQFVPFVCEYLPGPQVTSVNGLAGNVTLRGEPGIKVERLNETDIKVSIVGDPHFTRYNCIDNPQAEELSSFLEQLIVVHYNTQDNLVATPVKVNEDGGIDLRLKSKVGLNGAPLPLNERPAFRITVSGNTINLSMAGR